jgi:hypothetical protein
VVRVSLPRFGDVALVAVETAFEIEAHERPLVGLSAGCAAGSPALLTALAACGGCNFRVTFGLRHNVGHTGFPSRAFVIPCRDGMSNRLCHGQLPNMSW